MDYLFMLIFDVIFETSLEASQSSKVPKYIRYPLIVLIVLFFIVVIGLFFLVGILIMDESILGGIFFILLGIFFLVMSVIKFKELYIKKKVEPDMNLPINKFIFETCDYENRNNLNSKQKIVALCLWYDNEVNSGGHFGFFDIYPDIESNDMIEALSIIGNKKIVDNYKEALKNGKKDDYEKVDNNYYRFNPSLSNLIDKYIEHNKEDLFK